MLSATIFAGGFLNLTLDRIYGPLALIGVEIVIIIVCALLIPQVSQRKIRPVQKGKSL
jgi:hypothetical protein